MIYEFECPNEHEDKHWLQTTTFHKIPSLSFTRIDIYCKFCHKITSVSRQDILKSLHIEASCGECGNHEFNFISYQDTDGLELIHWVTVCAKCGNKIHSSSNYD